ncbi:MAG: histidine kinase dimerization/phospho-acceptor domain-containing protein, partial [Kiloniellales bacterium]
MTARFAPDRTAAHPPAAGAAQTRRVRLRTLVWIRWLALAGQTAALSAVRFALDYDFAFVAAMSVVLASGALNVAVSLLSPGDRWLGDREAAAQLAFDLLQLTALLALTGGLANPFAVLILAPVTVSASLLGRWATAGLALLAVALVSLLALWSLPLPGPLAGGLPAPKLLDFGLWLALILALVFVALYLSYVSHEARRLAAALAASELALGREQQVSALGALAAAAAHELGTPLATIAVVTGELRRALPSDSPLRDDLDLLRAESERCREILARISNAPARDSGASDPGAPFSRLPLGALVETAAAPYARPGVA